MLSVVILNVVILNVVMLNVPNNPLMLSVIVLSVVILNVIRLSLVAPFSQRIHDIPYNRLSDYKSLAITLCYCRRNVGRRNVFRSKDVALSAIPFKRTCSFLTEPTIGERRKKQSVENKYPAINYYNSFPTLCLSVCLFVCLSF